MKPIKYSLNFFLNKKEGSDIAPLRFRIVWNGGLRLSFNVGYSVDINHWNQDQQLCTKKSFHGKKRIPAVSINRTITTIIDKVADTFANFEEEGVCPTKEQLRDAIAPTDENVDRKNLITTYFDEFLKEGEADGWTDSTIEKLTTLKHHFRNYNKNLTFEDIDENFNRRIIQHFLDNGIANVTIKKYLKNIQWFVKWGQNKGYCNCSGFLAQKDKLKTAKRPIVFLTWEELMTIYNYDFSDRPALEQVRDVFCFSCFTSLRFSDVKNLKRSNIVDDNINITTKKTSTTLTIELNKYSRSILEKYKDFKLPDDLALPVISGQRTNEHLKTIAQLCRINSSVVITTYKGNKRIDTEYKKHELLTFHSGRRTFVSNALMLGIPANVVMKWTGHHDYKAMIPYIEIADATKKQAMGLFDHADIK